MATPLQTSERLHNLAGTIVAELGGATSYRSDYPFAIPTASGVRTRTINAAVFSSRTPSVNSALVGLDHVSADSDRASVLRDLSYLGSPLALIESNGTIDAYEFSGPLTAEKFDESPFDTADSWIRDRLIPRVSDSSQLALPLSERELIVAAAQQSLSVVVAALVADVQRVLEVSDHDAFGLALQVVRYLALGSSLPANLRVFAQPLRGTVAFANLPLDSVAELYESLGVDTKRRRRGGIVYTPAWVARYLVDRLPRIGGWPAVDPACGSGTFLVAYLERYLDDHALKHGQAPTADQVATAIAGMDIDPVAIEATRFTLDLFAARVGLDVESWTLVRADATSSLIPSHSLIGNLPFGYRTFEGRDDVSTAILKHWLRSDQPPAQLALLLPESFAYSPKSAAVRAMVRDGFNIQELISLPESVFDKTAVGTLGVVAARGSGSAAAIVREVTDETLDSFRVAGIARSYASPLPPDLGDPWPFSPFFNQLDRARSNEMGRLGSLAEVRLGLQTYGTVYAERTRSGPGEHALLEDPRDFVGWSIDKVRRLRRLPIGAQLRRSGPVGLFSQPKLLVRATTNPRQKARLAALWDEAGLWFTDKFVGVWITDASLLGLNSEVAAGRAVAAYFQTRFVETWLVANNPSRKIRVKTLEELPIPRLPVEIWAEAAELVDANAVVFAPRWRHGKQTALFEPVNPEADYRWAAFEKSVEAGFGLSPMIGSDFDAFLRTRQTVGRTNS